MPTLRPVPLGLLLVIAWSLLPLQAAERFPKPGPEKAFASVKLHGPDGSPIRTPREDWERAGQRLETNPEWKAWLAKRKATLDAWMEEPRDRPEYVTGWWHDFVSPVNGAFLEWTLTPPSDAPPKVFGGWVFGLRYRNAQQMLEAARMWRLTGEERYFIWAAGQLDFYARHYAQWPMQPEKGNSRLMHQSLDEATMLVGFIHTARLLDGAQPEAQRESYPARRREWIGKLFRPMALLLDDSFQRVHNIACWQRTAQAMAAIYAEDTELWNRAVDGEFGIRRQVRDGITSDYFWLEQSLGYNSYVVSALLPLFEMAAIAGRLDSLRQEAASVENLMLSPLVIRFPDSRTPTPADTTGIQNKVPNRAMLASARRVFPTTIGVAASLGSSDWGSLIDPPEPLPSGGSGDETLPEVESRSLESTRFAVLRKDGWQAFFHYGQLDRSHAQAEALSYEAYYHDTDVTHDAGTVGYGSPLHREYYTTAWAHNVPLIDLEGQQGWDEGDLLGFDAAEARVSARQPRYHPNASAERTLAIEDGALVETTTIAAKDNNVHRLGIILNIQGQVEAPQEAIAESHPPFTHWSNARTWRSPGNAVFRANIGGKPYRIEVKAPSQLRVLHATVPDAPPGKREALYLEVDGNRAQFRVAWRPE